VKIFEDIAMQALTVEAKRILLDHPDLLDTWSKYHNSPPPFPPGYLPKETVISLGNGYLPTFRYEGDVLIEFNSVPPDAPDIQLTIADDYPVALRIGDQAMFDHTANIRMPSHDLSQYEAQIADLEGQLEKAIAHVNQLIQGEAVRV
jgi:hypothetical protein